MTDEQKKEEAELQALLSKKPYTEPKPKKGGKGSIARKAKKLMKVRDDYYSKGKITAGAKGRAVRLKEGKK